MEITVGQVSGVIAVGIALLHLTFPLAITIVLAASLPKERNAVTLTVASRTLQSSLWSRILQTDSNARKGVAWSVLLLSWLATLATVLVSIASFVTPLGLEDEIKRGNTVPAEFIYVPDTSAFGLGTPPRTNPSFTRSCSVLACPGSSTSGGLSSGNGTAFNPDIPANITEAFSSVTGGHGSTVSGLWDIQYRQFSSWTDSGITYSTGTFRTLDMLILHNKVEPVEGLIVNSVNGGIGLRNHTIPASLNNGGSWNEDITWVSPSTQCVDTNLTLHYKIGVLTSPGSHIYIQDNGGFVNLARAYSPYAFDDEQANPDLRGRAYTGAWLANAYLMLGMNITTLETATNFSDPGLARLSAFTDSYLGKQFDVENTSIPWQPGADAINVGLLTDLFVYNSTVGSGGLGDYMFTGNYTLIDPNFLCNGFTESNVVDINTILVQCSMLYGAPRRSDGSDSRILEPGSEWTQNIYVCATGMEASVKEATFSFNGTANLDNLEITVADKRYLDNASKPLWAVENSGFELTDINPLWGLVSDEYENKSSLFTRRAESLWLPAGAPYSGSLSFPDDNIAAANVFNSALFAVTSLSLENGATDYTGKYNFALLHLWQELSANYSISAQIIDLIVTDILASAILGTKSSISPTESQASSASGTPTAFVTPLTKKITYKLFYGIPAFSVLLLWMLVILPAFLLWLVRTVTLERLRHTLNDTAAGRVVTSLVYPELCDPAASTDEWIKRAGRVRLVAPSARSGTNTLGEDAQPVKTREQDASVPNSRLLF